MASKKMLVFFSLISLLVIIIVSPSLVGCSTSSPASSPTPSSPASPAASSTTEPEYIWRIGVGEPPTATSTQAHMIFAELVEYRSNGRLKVEIHHSGVLGPQKDVIDMVQKGTVQGTTAPTGYLSPMVPWFSALDLPFTWFSLEEKWNAWDTWLEPMVDESLGDVGLKMIGHCELGFAHFISTKHPIITPDDMKGVKFRIMPSDIQKQYVEAWGGIPVVTDFSEVFSALEAGVIDAYRSSYQGTITSKYYEVIKYITESYQCANESLLMVNKAAFDELPEDLQDIVISSAVVENDWLRIEHLKKETQSKSKLIEMGKDVTVLTPEQLDEWKQASIPVYRWAAEQYGNDIVERLTGMKF